MKQHRKSNIKYQNEKLFNKKFGSLIFDLRYYFGIWFSVIKKSIINGTAYRFEFFSKIFRGIFIIATQLILVQIIFSKSKLVAGMSANEFYLIIGIYDFVNYISWGIFGDNLWELEERISRGDFDFNLLYPTGSIFSASFLKFYIEDAIVSFTGIILIAYYIYINWSSINITEILLFSLSLLPAFIIWYSLDLAVSATNFISLKNSLLDLKKQFIGISRYPIDIFSSKFQLFFFSIFPIAFIATVPGKFLVGDISWKLLIWGYIVAILILVLAIKFWNFCLKFYSSNG